MFSAYVICRKVGSFQSLLFRHGEKKRLRELASTSASEGIAIAAEAKK